MQCAVQSEHMDDGIDEQGHDGIQFCIRRPFFRDSISCPERTGRFLQHTGTEVGHFLWRHFPFYFLFCGFAISTALLCSVLSRCKNIAAFEQGCLLCHRSTHLPNEVQTFSHKVTESCLPYRWDILNHFPLQTARGVFSFQDLHWLYPRVFGGHLVVAASCHLFLLLFWTVWVCGGPPTSSSIRCSSRVSILRSSKTCDSCFFFICFSLFVSSLNYCLSTFYEDNIIIIMNINSIHHVEKCITTTLCSHVTLLNITD